MLKFIIPMLLLLMSNVKWNYFILFMTMLTVPSMFLMNMSNTPINLNPICGLDYMSMMLISLTLWIIPLVIIASQNIKEGGSFTLWCATLTLILLLSFSVSHLFLFYIMFEASLIPTLLIIMKWGYQPERLQASMYLMLYTITASLPLLAGITFFTLFYYSYNPFTPPTHYTSPSTSIWFIMNLAFMVKLPLFMFHLWLPKAHVEAPVAGSMILAAILLKLGGYGMLRMIYMINPPMSSLKTYIMLFALWGGMITSIICVRQQDMKALIAYSSVGHMSLVMAGVLSNLTWGIWGATAMMISHGLLSSALFASTDMSYRISNSRNLLMNKGLNVMLPTMSMLWFIMCAANMAAPPSCNLMAEIMLITSSSTVSKEMLIPLGVMSFTAAAYSLTLYVNINHGPTNAINFNLSYIPTRNLFIITAHVIPIVLVMLMPSLITLW